VESHDEHTHDCVTVRGAGSEFTCQPFQIDAPRADEALVRVSRSACAMPTLRSKAAPKAMKAGTVVKPMFCPVMWKPAQ
jgi:hypothetical protein